MNAQKNIKTPTPEHIAYIALGSNLDNPLQQVTQAIEVLNKHEDIKVLACSSWYTNPALTLPDDKNSLDSQDYVNGVCKVSCSLSAIKLLDALQETELKQGRTRTDIRWQARTLDLDILLFDDASIDTPRLTIPHSQMTQRAFVLYPLFEIEPDLLLPDGRALVDLKNQVSDKALEKIVISS